jgi:hypothetical protein
MDEAYDAVIRRLGAAPSRQDSSKDLWVYDTDTHKWAMAASASKMLAEHHKAFWAPLVSFAQAMRQHTKPNCWCQHRRHCWRHHGSSGWILAGSAVQRQLRDSRCQSACCVSLQHVQHASSWHYMGMVSADICSPTATALIAFAPFTITNRRCCLQEEEGDILELETRGLEVIGKAFTPPGGG